MKFVFPTAIALGLAFRPCGDDDHPFLARLYASTRWEEVARTGWPVEMQARFLAQQFDLQCRHYSDYYPNTERLLLECDGVPIGRVYIDETAAAVNLVDIALLPERRRRGIGRAVLADLLSQAAERGKPVILYVEKNNPARALYDALGFAVVRDEGVYDLMESPVRTQRPRFRPAP
jgi:GNAT superfamily N-acetyltransferase